MNSQHIDVSVFFVDGEIFMPLRRHRVYIIMAHERAGGAEVLEHLKLIIKGCSCKS